MYILIVTLTTKKNRNCVPITVVAVVIQYLFLYLFRLPMRATRRQTET